jgi:outer membrane protein
MNKFLYSVLVVFSSCALFAQVSAPTQLTLHDAEQMALKNNPQISIAKLLTFAQHQVVRETRSSELPFATGNLTAVDAHDGTRLTAGGLNNSSVFERAAAGVTVGQLITDFGRTRNLVSSQSLREQAQKQTEQATAADITLATDQSFYAALAAQAQLLVAQQTVTTRQTTADQVQALANAKLRSDLDLSFANVNLAQAKLLLLDSQNRKDAAFTNLNTILGFEKQTTYLLIDESNKALNAPPANQEDLVQDAMRSRPDLAAIDDDWQSAKRFARAEHDLNRPSISALAAVGGTPVRADEITSSWYGAAGVNMNIPIFNGFLFSSRAHEADYRASALQEQERDLRDRIARDVRVTWLQSNTAFQRVSVTNQLLQQANLALDLAQTRYKLGLSSIVELSQAQLQQTDAQIGNTNARYEYLSTLSALAYQTGK